MEDNFPLEAPTIKSKKDIHTLLGIALSIMSLPILLLSSNPFTTTQGIIGLMMVIGFPFLGQHMGERNEK